MSAGEEEDGERRRHPLCDDIVRLRELRRSSENLPDEIPRSEFRLTTILSASPLSLGQIRQHSEHRTDWDETQSARGENQNRPTSSGGAGGYATGGPVGGASGNPAAAAAAAAQSSVFGAQQPETAGTILSPTHGLDTSEHDGTGSYVYPGMVSTRHNGTGAESY